MTETAVTAAIANTLIAEAALMGIAAPLAGVIVQSSRRLAAGLVLLVVLAGAATAAMSDTNVNPLRGIALSHFTLAVAGLAAAGLGRLFASFCRDPLDAAACGLSVALLAGFAPLIAGPAAADLPTPVLNAALVASPIVATTSAANIDLFRTEPLYRISPIAHRRFDYPSWYAPIALYTSLAVAGFFAASRTRQPQLMPTTPSADHRGCP